MDTYDGYIARLPVFNKSMKVFGYELRYAANDPDGAVRLSESLVGGYENLGIEQVTGGKRSFVRLPVDLLLSDVFTLIPNRILIIEVGPETPPDEAVLAALARARGKGYTVAVQQTALTPQFAPLLASADIVKVDFTGTPFNRLAEAANLLAGKPVKLLAENLEQYEDFERAKEMGFRLFQGYFFCKPTMMTVQSELAPAKINCLHLLRLAFEPEANLGALQDVIKRDVALSYRLLRVVNSAFFGLRYTIKNIRQALVILGMNEIKKWVSLISMSELSDEKPAELLHMSLARARMMELLAPAAGMSRDADDLFMLGMFSLMDAITDLPYTEIIERTHISPTIAQPLLTGEGSFGTLLRMTVAYEQSDFVTAATLAQDLGITPAKLPDIYHAANQWAEQLE